MPISQRSFGVTSEGQEVILYTLSNDDGMRIEVMNYGGIIRAIEVPDRNGKQADITLGFDTLEPYLGRHPFFGALVGRFANRIGKARFSLDGTEIQLAQNNGENHLHGGLRGFDKKVWHSEVFQDEQACGLGLPMSVGMERKTIPVHSVSRSSTLCRGRSCPLIIVL